MNSGAAVVCPRLFFPPSSLPPAALSYEAAHHGRKHILVYDLGGGTFDVSVVRIEDEVVEVLASHGNNHLGGDDFDQKIVDHLRRHLQEKEKVDAKVSRQAMACIGRAAEAAKITLSDQPFAMIEEEYLLENQGRPVHLSVELAREAGGGTYCPQGR